ncbi:hypothetical protein D8674_038650 [Pyrus ussuriensis x Pyrus communis]|uniref:Uncharacterized protein n=1 Tax=Pyrus ussuriensis x Pyrus communis TaxID=2448454 RepID=A0A5N5I079_9ROSA|nr:hypothetical protein D8674_038650 [Pyrus ussuriensis x Pyrus communis]
MFKFKNGYCKVNADDVHRTFGILKENRFVDKYFSEMTRIDRREIAQAIQVAFDTGTTTRNQDAACRIILYLLNKNLFGSLARKLHWSLVKNCNSINNINQTKEETLANSSEVGFGSSACKNL